MAYTKKMKFGHKAEQGYIALMAVIIIGFILLGLSVNESLAGWHARFNVLSSLNKEQANSLAEGCADQAVASLIAEPTFLSAGKADTTTVTSQGSCSVHI